MVVAITLCLLDRGRFCKSPIKKCMLYIGTRSGHESPKGANPRSPQKITRGLPRIDGGPLTIALHGNEPRLRRLAFAIWGHPT